MRKLKKLLLMQWRYATEQQTREHHDKLVVEYTAKAEASCQCQQLLLGHNPDCYFSRKS